jgi:thiol-disulfide isomerase/thioredoxin
MKLRVLLFLSLLAGTAVSAAETFVALDRVQARALTDAATHAAPTIIALWSTECPHCKKNLELFAGMAKSDARLRLITVATEPVSAGLAAPLDRLGVPGRRHAYGTDAPEAIAHALDPKWRGELPRTLFLDGRGGRTALSGVVGEATVRQALGLPAAR